jgi:hypothetical protein
LKQILSNIKQSVFHAFGLYPIYDVLKEINKRFPLKGCSALEAFAHTGAWQARAYRQYPSYHEAWEINEWCEPYLKKNLPRAKIRITNSFEEIMKCDKKFDFINVDTHQGLFGAYCENFEFFPLMFRVMKDECVVNLNVIPYASEEWRKRYDTLFNKEHLGRREAFYKTGNPENVTLEQMLKIYGDIAEKNNYSITWSHYRQRTLTYYLVLHFKKKA